MLDLVVVSIEKITDRIRLFTFSSADDSPLPNYSAGAHVEFEIGEQTSRAYSLIDFKAVTEVPALYQVAVQLEPDGDGGSRFMHQLKVGNRIRATPPKNTFQLVDVEQPYLLLAGGIGITPLISMASELQRRGAEFRLHYSGRTASAMAFADTLQQQFPAQVSLYRDDVHEQRLDLHKLFENVTARQVYICGPIGMIEAARAEAEQAGIAASGIHVELFQTAVPSNPATDSAFEIELAQSGGVYTVPPDKTIIEVLEAAGLDVMYDCQRGDCGICQTDVIAGDIDHRDVVLSEQERNAGKVMQICVSRAHSGRLVLDI